MCSLPVKTSKSNRTLPLPQVAVDALRSHKAAFPPEEQDVWHRDGYMAYGVELVFTHTDNRPVLAYELGTAFSRACERAGLKGRRTFHMLRHSYASLAVRTGINVLELRDMMGHRSVQTTLDQYGHLFEDTRDRVRKMMDQHLVVNDT